MKGKSEGLQGGAFRGGTGKRKDFEKKKSQLGADGESTMESLFE